ncbi:MAG: hypothetical protein IJ141_00045 [Lachnospiraceae bacterium]|nr:hypothetical protein [Lachnospiraceae bacterium]
MNKCRKCNIDIMDDSIICPLCKNVLELSEDMKDTDNFGMYKSKSISYPDIVKKRKWIKFVIRLSIFLSIIAEIILVLINYATYKGTPWSVVTGAALIYICFTISYSFQRYVSHRSKLAVQVIAAIPLIMIIDHVYGGNGWSINYGIPIMVLVLDLVVFILSMVNFKKCHVYLMVQLTGIVMSLICSIFVILGNYKVKMLSIIATVVSVIIFMIIVFLGEKRSTSELAKRFRI